MDKEKIKFIVIGLIIFYLIQWFAPNKPIYFASYGIIIYFSYLATKSVIRSIVYTLILSFFSETSLAASLFKLEPDIGSGYFISALTILSFLLLIASFGKTKSTIHWTDWIALGFLLWNVVLFFLQPHSNSLFGILTLGEMTITYFLLRSTLDVNDLKVIPLLLSSMLIFQSIVASIQFLTQGNVGILAESANVDFPFGLTATEEEELFRSSGASYHANTLAMLLIILIPYLYSFKSTFTNIIKFVWIFVLFTTYSRIAWLIGGAEFLYLNISSMAFILKKKINIFLFMIFFIALIIINPLFLIRLETVPEALNEQGSWGVRMKTYQEAWHLFSRSPFTGVGANMYLTSIIDDPVTDLYQQGQVSVFKKIHNFFFEILTDNGIIGISIMSVFLIAVLKRTINDKYKIVFYAKTAMISFLIFVQFHPLFLTPQMRFIYLLSAIMLVK